MGNLVWITGAAGFIGSNLVRCSGLFAPGWEVRALNRQDLDLTDGPGLRRLFSEQKPDLVLHCAALSSSVTCQANPHLAHRVNVESTALLADLCGEQRFIFFSTDLVFDGRKGNYVEADPVNPLSIYGETKAVAEQIVLRNPRHTVIRTSLNFGRSPSADRAFNEQMEAAWRANKTIRLFADEYRCPIPVEVTAQAVWAMAVRQLTGLYHLAGRERLSRWEIGRLLAERLAPGQALIETASLRHLDPPRAPDTSLCCDKLQRQLPFELPGFSEWLQSHRQGR